MLAGRHRVNSVTARRLTKVQPLALLPARAGRQQTQL